MNSVILIGRLTRDPELRFTSAGKAVTTFSIAVDRPFIGEDGKADCKAQKLYKDGWGDLENKKVRRLLAEIALKENKGVRSIGYKNDDGRVSRLSKKKKRAC